MSAVGPAPPGTVSSSWFSEASEASPRANELPKELERTKLLLTSALAAADGDAENQKAMQEALAGVLALEAQLAGSGTRPATAPSSIAESAPPSADEALPETRSVGAGSFTLRATSPERHLVSDCDERIDVLLGDIEALEHRLNDQEEDSRQAQLDKQALEQVLAVKQQEAEALQAHKRELESQINTVGQAGHDRQAQVEAIRQKMEIEMAHSAQMLKAAQEQKKALESNYNESQSALVQARQQLQVAKTFSKQLETRTSAVTHKLRLAERRRLEAEQKLLAHQTMLQKQGNKPPSPAGGAQAAYVVEHAKDMLARRRLEHQMHRMQAELREAKRAHPLSRLALLLGGRLTTVGFRVCVQCPWSTSSRRCSSSPRSRSSGTRPPNSLQTARGSARTSRTLRTLAT